MLDIEDVLHLQHTGEPTTQGGVSDGDRVTQPQGPKAVDHRPGR